MPPPAPLDRVVEIAAPRPIAEYRDVDLAAFRDTIRPGRQPAVMRGLGADWPAVAAANESDKALVAYLRRFRVGHPVATIVGPPEIDGRFLYRDDFLALNFQPVTATLDSFFDWLLQQRTNPRPHAAALQSEKIPGIFPGFEQENRIDLVGPAVVPRAWMGNRIRVAPHYDQMENIGVVVAGRRRFILFPPEQLRNLYTGPLELTPAGTPVSLVDPLHPDLDRYPRFAEAMEAAQTATLGPGDGIYIPIHWWHGVDSLEPVNLFVNYWWNERRTDIGSPYDALMYGLYAIKTLPPEQREMWRLLFDHYVFQSNGDPVEHLPPNARGVLGEADPVMLERMRATLRQILQRL